MLPYWDEVELCHAQYCVPNPDALLPVAVATTYCTVLFVVELVLLNWPAALTASAASCDCVGCDGAPEHEVDLRCGLDADPAHAAVVVEVVRTPGPHRLVRLAIEDPHHRRLRLRLRTCRSSRGSRGQCPGCGEDPHEGAAEIAPTHHASLLDDNNRGRKLNGRAVEHKPRTG